MRTLRIIVIAAFYFGSVYFAVSALDPLLAAPIAWLAVLLAMLTYLFFDAVQKEEVGLPYGLLYLLPFICLAAGIIWWVMRLLGVWLPLR